MSNDELVNKCEGNNDKCMKAVPRDQRFCEEHGGWIAHGGGEPTPQSIQRRLVAFDDPGGETLMDAAVKTLKVSKEFLNVPRTIQIPSNSKVLVKETEKGIQITNPHISEEWLDKQRNIELEEAAQDAAAFGSSDMNIQLDSQFRSPVDHLKIMLKGPAIPNDPTLISMTHVRQIMAQKEAEISKLKNEADQEITALTGGPQDPSSGGQYSQHRIGVIMAKGKLPKVKNEVTRAAEKSAQFDGSTVFFNMKDAINNFTDTRSFRMSYVAWLDTKFLSKTEKQAILAAFDLGLALGQMRPKDKTWRKDVK